MIAAGAQYGQGYLLARPAFPLPEVTWPAELGGDDMSVPVTPRKKSQTLRASRTSTKSRRRS